MKILLACAAGMSTSLIVSRMQKAAQNKGMDIIIQAMPVTEAQKVLDEWDIVMLGPQVRYTLSQMKEASTNTPIGVIEMRDYGMMDGEKILNNTIALIEKSQK